MIKHLFSLLFVAITAIFTPQYEAFAGDSSQTCSFFDPNNGGSAQTNTVHRIVLTQGEVLTFTGSTDALFVGPDGVGFPDSAFGPLTSFVAPSDGTFQVIAQSSAVTVTCAPPSVGGDSTLRNVNRFVWVINRTRNSAITDGIRQTTQDALNGQQTSNYVTENSFGISSRGLAAISKQADNKKSLKSNDVFGINSYGADLDVRNVTETFQWNAWLKGRYDQFDGNSNSFDGGIGSVTVGLDRRLNNRFLVGILGNYLWSDFDIDISDALDVQSYSIGAYYGARVAKSVFSEGFFSYSRSDYDTVLAGNSGSFDADTFSFGASLYGSMPLGAVTIEPGATFAYSTEDQDSFIDSAANLIAGQDFQSGRFSVGPKVIFETFGDGNIKPFASVYYDLDFASSNTFNVAGTGPLNNASSARLGAGFNADVGRGKLEISGEVSGLGSGEFVAYGGSARLKIPF